MGNKVRVKARQTRGSGADEAIAGLKQVLVESYDDTKAEYDALPDDEQAKFDDILGSLADPFKQNAMMVELELNLVDDAEKRLEELNLLLDQ